MAVVQVQELPDCDLCSQEGVTRKAEYDTKTRMGPWANLCLEHMRSHGTQPSNKLELIKKREPQKTFTKTPTVSVPLSMDSVVTVKCPACGQGRRVETDANYLVTCESCGQKYQLMSMF